ncbi:MAG: penicillin-binding protein 2 [Treponema sp.]|nr:penicillin-binding protein 2 [Treponema sp.]
MVDYSRDLKETENKQNKLKKLVFMSVTIVACFIIYALKLFSMQIIEGEKYKNQSVNITQRSKVIPAHRGEIFDRNAIIRLVINSDSFAVDLTPGEIPAKKYDTVALKLASILGIPKSEIDKKVPVNVRRSYKAYEIKSNIPFTVISNVAENSNDLPGVSWRSKPTRNYVEKGSISHVLGYVGDITKEELKVLYNKGYSNTSIVGKTGIEKQYDELLQGKNGLESRTVDVRGRLVSEKSTFTEPEMGKNLVLTIDTKIQTLAEKALGKRVGSAIVLKPSNGEILAMVSYPYFDPNIFSNELFSEEYNKLAKDELNPLLNRTINAAYPPASTFKVIMSAAILAEDSFLSEKKIECTGRLEYGDRFFRCHIGIPGHGWMDLKHALAESCNIYYYTIGRDYLGVERISSYAKEFGFGENLNIDLPSHSKGFVPTAQWKERRFHQKWQGGDTLNLSIGQSYLTVTPMHVANMMAMVVNEGKIYKPHILKEVRDPITNEIIKEIKPEILKQTNMPKEIWKELKQDLRYTVTDGSARFPLKNNVVKIAGKTGTAEVKRYVDSWHSWFVCYAPFDADVDDMIVVCVLVEAVNTWEWWAPYATNIIMQGIFANQTYDEAVDALGFKYITKPRGRSE